METWKTKSKQIITMTVRPLPERCVHEPINIVQQKREGGGSGGGRGAGEGQAMGKGQKQKESIK